MIGRFCMAGCLVAVATGFAWADDWDWNGAYLGAGIGGGSLTSGFASDFGTLPEDDYHDGSASASVQAGYGRVANGIYFGAELDARAFKGAENSGIEIIGTIPVLNGLGQPGGGVTGGLGGAAVGACIGRCSATIPGALISDGDRIIGVTGDTLEAFGSEIKSTFSAQGRIGLPIGRFMPYAVAGVTAGRVTTRYLHLEEIIVRDRRGRLRTDVRGGILDDSGWAYGYTVGLGTEIALTRQFFLRAEYLHTDLGRVKIGLAGVDGDAEISSKLDQGSTGFVYRF
ncbi:MAG: porin family protein [Rhizobiaceae bacterium]|nr:porin family protein [Rhizobiaceae bacterium]